MIRNVIFDLGNVLVKVDFARFEKNCLLITGINEKKFDRFFRKKIRRDFESGRMTADDFMELAHKELSYTIPKSKLRFVFTDMFDEMPEMKNFLVRLHKSRKFRLYLFSNTNPLHFNYIKKKFAYVNLIDKFILSYKFKMVKPDKKIYRTVLKKFNLNPEETLFIDDSRDNCLAAKKFGIKTICYKRYSLFVKQFIKITAV